MTSFRSVSNYSSSLGSTLTFVEGGTILMMPTLASDAATAWNSGKSSVFFAYRKTSVSIRAKISQSILHRAPTSVANTKSTPIACMCRTMEMRSSIWYSEQCCSSYASHSPHAPTLIL